MNAFLRQISFAIVSLIMLAIIPAGAALAQVKVTSATPASTTQGTISLDVVIAGSGFDNTATAQFLVTGTTNPGGVTVRSIRFQNSKQITATIDVADAATVSSYDIVVTLDSGRKGKGTTLFSVQAKGNSEPPPPAPPPPGSCAGAEGVFPAFAYTKVRSIRKRRSVSYDGEDLYVANSTGSCSVQLAIESYLFDYSYRQIGDEIRIVWTDTASLKLIRLPVTSGGVVPVLPSIVYTLDIEPSGIHSVELSPDGQTIYLADEILTAEGVWLDTIKSIDITSCTLNCTAQTLYTAIDKGMGGLSINDTGDRLYMSIHDRVPDIRTISFMQKESDVWSPPVHHVVSNADSPYTDIRGFGHIALGSWDYDVSGGSRDVVAVQVERFSGDTTDVFDISNCAPGGTRSCYAEGLSDLVRSGLADGWLDFTSITSSSDPGPNVLRSVGDWRDLTDRVLELDPDSMTETPLLQGRKPDSAD